MSVFVIPTDIHLTSSVQNQVILSAAAGGSINNLALRHIIYRFILVTGNLSPKERNWVFSIETSENSNQC